MPKYLMISAGALLLIGFGWLLCYGDWHENRNKCNKLPQGNLTFVVNSQYKDQAGLVWELQSHRNNVFHQPDDSVEPIADAYSILDEKPELDVQNPNLKFLSKLEGGGSFEAILQPDGNFLLTGPKRGTYNYAHPDDVIGKIKHLFLDVIPHLINSNYR